MSLKAIIKMYTSEKKALLFCYGLNTGTLIYFFHLDSAGQYRIVYPLVLAVFYLTFYLAVDFMNFRKFHKNLQGYLRGYHPIFETTRASQAHIKDLIDNIQSHYEDRLSTLEEKHVKDLRFNAQWIHNMKTPLSVNSLILDEISARGIDEGWLKDLKMSQTRLLKQLDQGLQLNRLNDFSKDYHAEDVDLHLLIKEIINEQKNVFIYKGVFPKLMKNQAYHVFSDRKWLKFLMEQLVFNAVKYSHRNGEVLFDFQREDDKTLLSIKDQGLGIEAYDLKRVFEPFFTGQNGRSREDASGLGLYLCKQIADKLGHDIDIKSQVKEGTLVQVTCLTKS